MAPISSADNASRPLDRAERETLLELARRSIRHGLEQGTPLSIDVADYPPRLQAQRAVFVTLNRLGQLRGCIGHLEAVQPLVNDVGDNAFAAAFRDPRFPPLATAELEGLEIHISVLSPPSAMSFTSEADLLGQLQPGVDGLILEDGPHRGTFLPSVWEQLPIAADFLRQLKRKAGLTPGYWSETLKVSRYHTESFS